jgi:hypothetical protein
MDPEKVTYFAETDARNKKVKFGIKAKDRTRHVYVIGKTGMGKSTMLENMAIQDIQGGEGMAFVDPHGKTADLLLDYVPKERINDVIYFAPFDTDHPVSFNVMEDVGIDKRHLVANGLMSAFKKIWIDAWSARMEYILNNTILALLEYPDSTLVGINRMLSDKDYRNKVVSNISDPSVKSFWVDEFAKYGERYMQEAGAAIQNKVGQFVSNPLVRNIIGQPKSSFDFRKVMDEKKIVIINLSKGRVGEQNANLLGSMIITKVYLAALSRADISENILKNLPNFYLYVDEFQSFANESFADILSEARKYKLNLTIAHQYIEQMSEEVRAAVFGNVGTMVAFRVGAFDAEVLEKEFAPTFTAEDMVNLGFVQIYLKLMIDGISSAPFSATTLAPIQRGDISYRHDIIEHSRETFARPKNIVEDEIRAWHEEVFGKGSSSSPSFQKERGDRFNSSEKSVAPARFERSPQVAGQGSVPSKQINGAERFPAQRKPEVVPNKKEIFASIISEEKKSQVSSEQNNKISLETLKPNDKKSKDATPEHVSQLREVLATLTNKQNSNHQQAPVDSKESKQKVEHHQNPKQEKVIERDDQFQKKIENKEQAHKKPNEIPEDELRKMLQVDPIDLDTK